MDEDWVAVRRHDADEEAANVGDERVAAVEVARPGDQRDLRTMHLPGRHDALGADLQKRAQPPVILPHMLRIVTGMPSKIQRILRRNAHPARAGGLERHKVGDGGED